MMKQPSQTEDTAARAREAIRRGLDNLAALQTPDGSWRGDYGGPMFLLPMYLALCHIAGHALPAPRAQRMREYLLSTQNGDGSVGLHAWGPGCMFTTSLVYCGLRLLGLSAEEPRLASMRGWIHRNGTPLRAASWGKFVLAVLNLYDWRGLNPLLPELWLLPYAFPLHPGRMWCHARQVYLPMSWLYGTRSTAPLDPLLSALRGELYGTPWEAIRFEDHRDAVAPTDEYRPVSAPMRAIHAVLSGYERLAPGPVRRRALDRVYEHILYEARATSDIAIGPVNAVLNALCHHFQDPGGAALRRSFAALDGEYLWEGHDGLKMQGYNSSQLWDTAFAVQAVLATPSWRDHPHLLERAHGYLRDNQILEDVPDAERYYRHRSRGGWPFSTRAHGWPITDCTAEGFKCAVALERIDPARRVPEELLREAVRLILSFQNDDGGWATYERQRAGAWLEWLNPSQVFGDIMVDASFVECTSACLQALAKARARFPGELDRQLLRAVRRGERFLRRAQRDDGSFEGSWGVCFTYGTWFGVSGLLAAGASPGDPAIRRACRFLLDHQAADGGWGEHFSSCSERRYVPHPTSQAVMTSWALLALVRARCPEAEALRRAADFLAGRQSPDGSWAREAVAGVFNRTCMITYDNYRHYFPVWALAEWLQLTSPPSPSPQGA